MKAKKSQKIIAENQLRVWVRKSIKEDALKESIDDSWANSGFGGLIDAWKPLFQSLKIGGASILSNVITQLRLFTTFNSRKAQQIIDRQKDRNQKFKQELDAIKTPIGPDIAVWAFYMNPGAVISYVIGDKTGKAATDTIQWLKEAGVGDFAIDELEPGGNVAKRKREEEESGPVAKLLRSLEDIFLLRMGAEDQGNLLSEAKGSIGATLTSEILGGEFGDKIKAGRSALMQSVEEIYPEIEKAEIQIDFLKNIGKVSNLKELQASLDNLEQMLPDADLGDIQALPEQLKKDVANMLNDEEAKNEAAKNILTRNGKTDPTEEDISQISEEEIAAELEGLAFGNAVQGFRQGAGEQISQIKIVYEKMMKELFPPPEGIAEKIWKESEYGQAIEKLEKQVAALGA